MDWTQSKAANDKANAIAHRIKTLNALVQVVDKLFDTGNLTANDDNTYRTIGEAKTLVREANRLAGVIEDG